MEAVFKKSASVIFRKIAGEFVLVPIHKDAVDLEALFSFNETGARIWELIDGQRKGSEIARLLAEEFSQPVSEVLPDVREFLIQIAELRFVESAASV